MSTGRDLQTAVTERTNSSWAVKFRWLANANSCPLFVLGDFDFNMSQTDQDFGM